MKNWDEYQELTPLCQQALALRAQLENLNQQIYIIRVQADLLAGRPPLRICTLGTCTPEVARLRWLQITDPARNHDFKLALSAVNRYVFILCITLWP